MKKKTDLKYIFLLFLVCSCAVSVFYLFPFDYVNFVTPVVFERQEGEGLPIRNDDLGDGFYHASRVGGRKHKGIDLAEPIGTPVRAVRSGRVFVAKELGNYGKHVKIIHDKGQMSVYAHLSEIYVKEGQKVWQGTRIGAVGRTGNADYDDMIPHVHFEMRQDDVRIDPTPFVEAGVSTEGSKMLFQIVRMYIRDTEVSLSRLFNQMQEQKET